MLKILRMSRFRRDQKGATAVEFALILPIFLVFVLGIMDLSAFYFVQGQLQNAVEQAARNIRVGEASVIGTTSTERDGFRALVCSEINTVMVRNCPANLLVNVVSVDTSDDTGSGNDFSDLSNGDIGDTNGDGTIDDADTGYDPGQGGYAVVATVYYVYHFIIPQMAVLTGGAAGDHELIAISATTAFRNEPFGP